MRLQLVSCGVSFHETAMQAVATSTSWSRCGTSFLDPVVPLVNKYQDFVAVLIGLAPGWQ